MPSPVKQPGSFQQALAACEAAEKANSSMLVLNKSEKRAGLAQSVQALCAFVADAACWPQFADLRTVTLLVKLLQQKSGAPVWVDVLRACATVAEDSSCCAKFVAQEPLWKCLQSFTQVKSTKELRILSIQLVSMMLQSFEGKLCVLGKEELLRNLVQLTHSADTTERKYSRIALVRLITADKDLQPFLEVHQLFCITKASHVEVVSQALAIIANQVEAGLMPAAQSLYFPQMKGWVQRQMGAEKNSGLISSLMVSTESRYFVLKGVYLYQYKGDGLSDSTEPLEKKLLVGCEISMSTQKEGTRKEVQCIRISAGADGSKGSTYGARGGDEDGDSGGARSKTKMQKRGSRSGPSQGAKATPPLLLYSCCTTPEGKQADLQRWRQALVAASTVGTVDASDGGGSSGSTEADGDDVSENSSLPLRMTGLALQHERNRRQTHLQSHLIDALLDAATPRSMAQEASGRAGFSNMSGVRCATWTELGLGERVPELTALARQCVDSEARVSADVEKAAKAAEGGSSTSEDEDGLKQLLDEAISNLEVVEAVARLFSLLSMVGSERKRKMMVQSGVISTALLLITRRVRRSSSYTRNKDLLQLEIVREKVRERTKAYAIIAIAHLTEHTLPSASSRSHDSDHRHSSSAVSALPSSIPKIPEAPAKTNLNPLKNKLKSAMDGTIAHSFHSSSAHTALQQVLRPASLKQVVTSIVKLLHYWRPDSKLRKRSAPTVLPSASSSFSPSTSSGRAGRNVEFTVEVVYAAIASLTHASEAAIHLQLVDSHPLRDPRLNQLGSASVQQRAKDALQMQRYHHHLLRAGVVPALIALERAPFEAVGKAGCCIGAVRLLGLLGSRADHKVMVAEEGGLEFLLSLSMASATQSTEASSATESSSAYIREGDSDEDEEDDAPVNPRYQRSKSVESAQSTIGSASPSRTPGALPPSAGSYTRRSTMLEWIASSEDPQAPVGATRKRLKLVVEEALVTLFGDADDVVVQLPLPHILLLASTPHGVHAVTGQCALALSTICCCHTTLNALDADPRRSFAAVQDSPRSNDSPTSGSLSTPFVPTLQEEAEAVAKAVAELEKEAEDEAEVSRVVESLASSACRALEEHVDPLASERQAERLEAIYAEVVKDAELEAEAAEDEMESAYSHVDTSLEMSLDTSIASGTPSSPALTLTIAAPPNRPPCSPTYGRRMSAVREDDATVNAKKELVQTGLPTILSLLRQAHEGRFGAVHSKGICSSAVKALDGLASSDGYHHQRQLSLAELQGQSVSQGHHGVGGDEGQDEVARAMVETGVLHALMAVVLGTPQQHALFDLPAAGGGGGIMRPRSDSNGSDPGAADTGPGTRQRRNSRTRAGRMIAEGLAASSSIFTGRTRTRSRSDAGSGGTVVTVLSADCVSVAANAMCSLISGRREYHSLVLLGTSGQGDGVRTLLDLLKDGGKNRTQPAAADGRVRAGVASILAVIASSSGNRRHMLQQGAVRVLLQGLINHAPDSDAAVQAESCEALAALAQLPAVQNEVCSDQPGEHEGGLRRVCELLGSSDNSVVAGAAHVLYWLCCNQQTSAKVLSLSTSHARDKSCLERMVSLSTSSAHFATPFSPGGPKTATAALVTHTLMKLFGGPLLVGASPTAKDPEAEGLGTESHLVTRLQVRQLLLLLRCTSPSLTQVLSNALQTLASRAELACLPALRCIRLPSLSGWLKRQKLNNILTKDSWERRFFVLDHGYLYRFGSKSVGHASMAEPSQKLRLRGCIATMRQSRGKDPKPCLEIKMPSGGGGASGSGGSGMGGNWNEGEIEYTTVFVLLGTRFENIHNWYVACLEQASIDSRSTSPPPTSHSLHSDTPTTGDTSGDAGGGGGSNEADEPITLGELQLGSSAGFMPIDAGAAHDHAMLTSSLSISALRRSVSPIPPDINTSMMLTSISAATPTPSPPAVVSAKKEDFKRTRARAQSFGAGYSELLIEAPEEAKNKGLSASTIQNFAQMTRLPELWESGSASALLGSGGSSSKQDPCLLNFSRLAVASWSDLRLDESGAGSGKLIHATTPIGMMAPLAVILRAADWAIEVVELAAESDASEARNLSPGVSSSSASPFPSSPAAGRGKAKLHALVRAMEQAARLLACLSVYGSDRKRRQLLTKQMVQTGGKLLRMREYSKVASGYGLLIITNLSTTAGVTQFDHSNGDKNDGGVGSSGAISSSSGNASLSNAISSSGGTISSAISSSSSAIGGAIGGGIGVIGGGINSAIGGVSSAIGGSNVEKLNPTLELLESALADSVQSLTATLGSTEPLQVACALELLVRLAHGRPHTSQLVIDALQESELLGLLRLSELCQARGLDMRVRSRVLLLTSRLLKHLAYSKNAKIALAKKGALEFLVSLHDMHSDGSGKDGNATSNRNRGGSGASDGASGNSAPDWIAMDEDDEEDDEEDGEDGEEDDEDEDGVIKILDAEADDEFMDSRCREDTTEGFEDVLDDWEREKAEGGGEDVSAAFATAATAVADDGKEGTAVMARRPHDAPLRGGPAGVRQQRTSQQQLMGVPQVRPRSRSLRTRGLHVMMDEMAAALPLHLPSSPTSATAANSLPREVHLTLTKLFGSEDGVVGELPVEQIEVLVRTNIGVLLRQCAHAFASVACSSADVSTATTQPWMQGFDDDPSGYGYEAAMRLKSVAMAINDGRKRWGSALTSALDLVDPRERVLGSSLKPKANRRGSTGLGGALGEVVAELGERFPPKLSQQQQQQQQQQQVNLLSESDMAGLLVSGGGVGSPMSISLAERRVLRKRKMRRSEVAHTALECVLDMLNSAMDGKFEVGAGTHGEAIVASAVWTLVGLSEEDRSAHAFSPNTDGNFVKRKRSAPQMTDALAKLAASSGGGVRRNSSSNTAKADAAFQKNEIKVLAEYREVVVLKHGVSALMRVLGSDTTAKHTRRAAAAGVISLVRGKHEYHSLVMCGTTHGDYGQGDGVGMLLRLLAGDRRADEGVRAAVASLMGAIASSDDIRQHIMDKGGLRTLFAALQMEKASPVLEAESCEALAALAQLPAVQNEVCSDQPGEHEGGLRRVCELLGSDDHKVVAGAAHVLYWLCCNLEASAKVLSLSTSHARDKSCLERMVSLSTHTDETIRRWTCATLSKLFCGGRNNSGMGVSSMLGIGQLMRLLRCSVPEVVRSALSVVNTRLSRGLLPSVNALPCPSIAGWLLRERSAGMGMDKLLQASLAAARGNLTGGSPWERSYVVVKGCWLYRFSSKQHGMAEACQKLFLPGCVVALQRQDAGSKEPKDEQKTVLEITAWIPSEVVAGTTASSRADHPDSPQRPTMGSPQRPGLVGTGNGGGDKGAVCCVVMRLAALDHNEVGVMPWYKVLCNFGLRNSSGGGSPRPSRDSGSSPYSSPFATPNGKSKTALGSPMRADTPKSASGTPIGRSSPPVELDLGLQMDICMSGCDDPTFDADMPTGGSVNKHAGKSSDLSGSPEFRSRVLSRTMSRDRTLSLHSSGAADDSSIGTAAGLELLPTSLENEPSILPHQPTRRSSMSNFALGRGGNGGQGGAGAGDAGLLWDGGGTSSLGERMRDQIDRITSSSAIDVYDYTVLNAWNMAGGVAMWNDLRLEQENTSASTNLQQLLQLARSEGKVEDVVAPLSASKIEVAVVRSEEEEGEEGGGGGGGGLGQGSTVQEQAARLLATLSLHGSERKRRVLSSEAMGGEVVATAILLINSDNAIIKGHGALILANLSDDTQPATGTEVCHLLMKLGAAASLSRLVAESMEPIAVYSALRTLYQAVRSGHSSSGRGDGARSTTTIGGIAIASHASLSQRFSAEIMEAKAVERIAAMHQRICAVHSSGSQPSVGTPISNPALNGASATVVMPSLELSCAQQPFHATAQRQLTIVSAKLLSEFVGAGGSTIKMHLFHQGGLELVIYLYRASRSGNGGDNGGDSSSSSSTTNNTTTTTATTSTGAVVSSGLGLEVGQSGQSGVTNVYYTSEETLSVVQDAVDGAITQLFGANDGVVACLPLKEIMLLAETNVWAARVQAAQACAQIAAQGLEDEGAQELNYNYNSSSYGALGREEVGSGLFSKQVAAIRTSSDVTMVVTGLLKMLQQVSAELKAVGKGERDGHDYADERVMGKTRQVIEKMGKLGMKVTDKVLGGVDKVADKISEKVDKVHTTVQIIASRDTKLAMAEAREAAAEAAEADMRQRSLEQSNPAHALRALNSIIEAFRCFTERSMKDQHRGQRQQQRRRGRRRPRPRARNRRPKDRRKKQPHTVESGEVETGAAETVEAETGKGDAKGEIEAGEEDIDDGVEDDDPTEGGLAGLGLDEDAEGETIDEYDEEFDDYEYGEYDGEGGYGYQGGYGYEDADPVPTTFVRVFLEQQGLLAVLGALQRVQELTEGEARKELLSISRGVRLIMVKVLVELTPASRAQGKSTWLELGGGDGPKVLLYELNLASQVGAASTSTVGAVISNLPILNVAQALMMGSRGGVDTPARYREQLAVLLSRLVTTVQGKQRLASADGVEVLFTIMEMRKKQEGLQQIASSIMSTGQSVLSDTTQSVVLNVISSLLEDEGIRHHYFKQKGRRKRALGVIFKRCLAVNPQTAMRLSLPVRLQLAALQLVLVLAPDSELRTEVLKGGHLRTIMGYLQGSDAKLMEVAMRIGQTLDKGWVQSLVEGRGVGSAFGVAKGGGVLGGVLGGARSSGGVSEEWQRDMRTLRSKLTEVEKLLKSVRDRGAEERQQLDAAAERVGEEVDEEEEGGEDREWWDEKEDDERYDDDMVAMVGSQRWREPPQVPSLVKDGEEDNGDVGEEGESGSLQSRQPQSRRRSAIRRRRRSSGTTSSSDFNCRRLQQMLRMALRFGFRVGTRIGGGSADIMDSSSSNLGLGLPAMVVAAACFTLGWRGMSIAWALLLWTGMLNQHELQRQLQRGSGDDDRQDEVVIAKAGEVVIGVGWYSSTEEQLQRSHELQAHHLQQLHATQGGSMGGDLDASLSAWSAAHRQQQFTHHRSNSAATQERSFQHHLHAARKAQGRARQLKTALAVERGVLLLAYVVLYVLGSLTALIFDDGFLSAVSNLCTFVPAWQYRLVLPIAETIVRHAYSDGSDVGDDSVAAMVVLLLALSMLVVLLSTTLIGAGLVCKYALGVDILAIAKAKLAGTEAVAALEGEPAGADSSAIPSDAVSVDPSSPARSQVKGIKGAPVAPSSPAAQTIAAMASALSPTANTESAKTAAAGDAARSVRASADNPVEWLNAMLIRWWPQLKRATSDSVVFSLQVLCRCHSCERESVLFEYCPSPTLIFFGLSPTFAALARRLQAQHAP
jgi:hypothetical protein